MGGKCELGFCVAPDLGSDASGGAGVDGGGVDGGGVDGGGVDGGGVDGGGGGATAIRFTPDFVFATVANFCAGPLTVETRDLLNAVAPVSVLTNVTLSSDPSGVTFFDAAGCAGGGTAAVNIPSGGSTVSFYARATVAASYTLTAAGAGLGEDTQSFDVSAAAAAKLDFQPSSQTIKAGACSAAVTVERQDPFDNPVAAGGALTVDLASSATGGTFTFHTASDCGSGSSVTGVDVPALSSSTTVYLSATKAEVVEVTGSGGGLTSDIHTLTVVPDDASKVAFAGAPPWVLLNTCSAPITVQLQDRFGNPVIAGAGTPVVLTDDSTNFDFHLAADCSDPATGTATILAGQSSTPVYVRSSTSDPQVTMTASVVGLTAGAQDLDVSGIASKLVFINLARAIYAGTCSEVLTVQRQDTGSAPATIDPLTVTLSSAAAGGLTFHADSSCSTPGVSSAQIGDGQSSVDFYVRANVAQTVLLTATAAGSGLNDGQQSFTTNVGPPAMLSFTSPSPQTLAALNCSAQTTVTLQDLGGNPVDAGGTGRLITFSATPAGPNLTFWTDAACTNPVTCNILTMGSNSSMVPMFFKASNAGSATLAAATPGITPGTQGATITPADPKKLVFTTPAPTVEAGFCQALTLERQDALSRPTAPAYDTAVTSFSVSAPPAGGLATELFSNSTCSALLVSPFNVLSGQANTFIYVKGRSGDVAGGNTTAAHVYLVAASAGVLTAATLNVTVLPMVRRGSCTLGATTVTCAVTPNLTSIGRTFLVYQATADKDDRPDYDMVTCRLQMNSSLLAEVVCDRLGDGANVTVEWQAVSFAYDATQGGVSVQHLSINQSDAGQPFQDIAVSSSARASSFVLFSARTAESSTTDGNEQYMTEMIGDTTVRVSFAPNGSFQTNGNTSNVFVAQVVNWTGASVARGVSPVGDGGTVDVSQATPNLPRSFLLHSSRMADIYETGPDICARRLSGLISDTAKLTFQRGCTGSSPADDVKDVSWERVELPANVSVQQLTAPIANGQANSGDLTITSVDRTRAFAFSGGQVAGGLANGRTNDSASDRLGSSQANVNLTSATVVRLNRLDNVGDATWGVFVVEVTP